MKNRGMLITGVFFLILGAILMLNTFSTIGAQPETNVTNVSAKEALAMIKNEKDVFILDVRTPEEFDGPLGHLDGAELLPVQVLEQNIEKLNKYKDKKVLLVCRTGMRSTAASQILSRHGFGKLFNLSGGMVAVREVAPASR